MDTKEIKAILEHHEKLKRQMLEGEAYYRHQNTFIMERKKEFYNISQGKKVEDYTKANYKLPSGFTKLIIDQKVNYLINEKTKLDTDTQEILTLNFKRTLKRIAKDASNQIRGVLQFYIDDTLKYKRIKPAQVVLIYSEEDEEQLLYVIRCYLLGQEEIIEVWDDMTVKRYMKDKSDNYILIEEKPHIEMVTKSGDTTLSIEGNSWGRPPFAVLWNDDEKQNDLSSFKLFVDMYDLISSDFGNNFDDFGEMYWVLKNYNGQDAKSFMKEFKESRIMKVAGDGDANGVTQEVPHMARKELLTILKEDIYEFAMAVDPKTIRGDSTNLTIEALFYNLDLKAADFETEVQDFFTQCMYFVNRYNEIQGKEAIEGELKLGKQKFVNKKESIETFLMQVGTRPMEKLLEEHPDVEDVAEELALIEKMNANNISDLETQFEE